MRHAVSPNQLVLWPHHELTEAWAPTGIRLSAGKDTEVGGEEAGERDAEQHDPEDQVSRGIDPDPVRRDVNVLTRNGGVCGQAGRMVRRTRGTRRGGPAGARRAAADLV